MKRLLLVLAVALTMAAMVATTAAPALAQLPSGACAGGVVGIMGEPPKDANLCAFVGT